MLLPNNVLECAKDKKNRELSPKLLPQLNRRRWASPHLCITRQALLSGKHRIRERQHKFCHRASDGYEAHHMSILLASFVRYSGCYPLDELGPEPPVVKKTYTIQMILSQFPRPDLDKGMFSLRFLHCIIYSAGRLTVFKSKHAI